LIQKPFDINLRDQAIDRNEDYLIRWKTSGDISTSFSIEIYNNDDDTLMWSIPRTYSYALSYTIPANSLTANKDCKIAITVWNSAGEFATSNFVTFTVTSKPVVTVDPFDIITNHSYLFTATYSQSEMVRIRSYTVNLYDANQVLIRTSGEKTDELLEHRFSALKNNTSYFVEFIVVSKFELSASSGLLPFSVQYENPDMYFEVSAANSDKASIKLNWKVIQVIGKTSIEPIYIDGQELDVREGKVYFDEGFSLDRDFTLNVWLRNIPYEKDLISLNGTNGQIYIQYWGDNRFHMFKKIGNFTAHYATNQVEGNEYFLCIQQIGRRMNIYAESKKNSLKSLNKLTFNDLNGVTFGQLKSTLIY
jgi:hypothetical protein